MTARATARFHDLLQVIYRLTRPSELWQIRRFGQSVISAVFRTPVLVLHTTGRSSGLERSTPLAFHRGLEGTLLVVGGAGGQTRTPDWVANARVIPVAAVTLDRVRHDVEIKELVGVDREQAWRELRSVWPRIDTYQRRTTREVPVFRITPTSPTRSTIVGSGPDAA